MEHNIFSILEQRLQNMKSRRRWHRIIALVACVAFVVTISALTLPAISQSDETFCGLSEHTHGDECYIVELVCSEGREESSEGESSEEAEDASEAADDPVTPSQEETAVSFIAPVSPVLSLSENTASAEEIVTIVEITTLSEEITQISETVTEIVHTQALAVAEENGTDEAVYSESETYIEEITALTEITTLVETVTKAEMTTSVAVTEETSDEESLEESSLPPEEIQAPEIHVLYEEFVFVGRQDTSAK